MQIPSTPRVPSGGTARGAVEILMCRDYELRNRRAPLHPSPPCSGRSLFTCILMRCHPYFSLYARPIPRIIHDNSPAPPSLPRSRSPSIVVVVDSSCCCAPPAAAGCSRTKIHFRSLASASVFATFGIKYYVLLLISSWRRKQTG